MSSVKRNIITNYFGSGWCALMGMAFIPLYIHYLGIEAYGVIGIFVLLQSWLFVLDLGITPTLSREMARFDAGAHTPQSICDLVRSLELIYLLIAVIIASVLTTGSSWLTTHWLQVESLSKIDVENALSLTGVFISLRWFVGLYRGALIGLQQHVWINGSNVFFATVRGLGVVGVLAWISPTILAFLVFQGAMAALEVLVLAFKTHRLLPSPPEPARFRWESLQQVWRFAAGMTANMVQILFLTQADKLLLSKLLPLTDFGYYVLATTLASGLYVAMGAITTVAYPQFAMLIARGETTILKEAYHNLSQILTLIIVPSALVLSFFSENILLLWTQNLSTAAVVAPLVSLLAIGNMINGMTQIPYYLQLASGWTRLNIVVNFLATIVLIPSVYFAIPVYGAIAAPIIWIILNIGFIVLSIPIMHNRLLPTEMWLWYKQDIVLPMLSALCGIGIVYFLAPTPTLEGPLVNVATLTAAAIVGLVATTLATPLGRKQIRRDPILFNRLGRKRKQRTGHQIIVVLDAVQQERGRRWS